MNAYLKQGVFFSVSLIIILITLSPAFSLPLHTQTFDDLRVIKRDDIFGRDLSFSNPPPSFYLQQYGPHFFSTAISYKLFGFNSKMYFSLNIFLRLLATFSIYYFVSKWSGNKIAGIISSIFFGVNTAGIDSTTRVTQFHTYISIVSLMIFLDRWFKFHYRPGKKSLIISIIFFFLTILSFPIRMVGVVLFAIAGELYWIIKSSRESKLKIFHFLLLTLATIIIFLLGSINSTQEISSKGASLQILFLSLITGNPPILHSFFLFISNLIIPIKSFFYEFLNVNKMTTLSNFLPLLGSLFLLKYLIKKNLLLALMSLIVIGFPILFYLSHVYLTDWNPLWVLITQFGGTLFLSMILLLASVWKDNKRISEIGFLGIGLVVFNLIPPWMISPQSSLTDQSAFNSIHRYYTVPSVGMGILLGIIFSISIQKLIKSSSLLYKISSGLVAIAIIVALTLQSLTTYYYLKSETKNVNAQKIDQLWNEFEPYILDIVKNETAVVYIERNKDLNEEYIKKYFPHRMAIYTGKINTTPSVDFIFIKEELSRYLPQEKIFAFKFDGRSLFNIKNNLKK